MELIIKKSALELLTALTLREPTVRVTAAEDGVHFGVMIGTPDAPLLIGRRGENLQAFQHVLRRTVEVQAGRKKVVVTVDVDGYRSRQADEAVETALRLAEQVTATGQPARLRPEPALVRRAVHLAVAEAYPDLTSDSEGSGPLKVVVLKRK